MSVRTYNESIVKVELQFIKLGKKVFDAYLVEGEWPNDDKLITLCDGGDPDLPSEELRHDGGFVDDGSFASHKVVTVYQ